MVRIGFPYGVPKLPGFWGPTNSQFNFCEEDYIITNYIAEFINTFTNLTYILYAVNGIIRNYGRKDALSRDIPYIGILLVGIGSTIFHASNKFYTQWADDLSMLVAVACVLHRVYTFESSVRTTVLSGLGLAAFLTAFGVWHCVTDELIMHSLLFGIMIVLVGIKTRGVISHRVEDPDVKREVMRVVTWGGVIFVSGYGIWNLDNFFCDALTSAKHSIGMPWSFVLELHGWWHIFTGIGAYTFIALVEYLTSDEAGDHLAGRFAWPVGLLVSSSNCDTKTPLLAAAEDGTSSEVAGTHGTMESGSSSRGLSRSRSRNRTAKVCVSGKSQ